MIWHNIAVTVQICKRPNKCKDFELNPIDALGENPKDYKPRDKTKKMDQISI